jgi:hypothetical protein
MERAPSRATEHAAEPALPPESPLAMPVQSLSRWSAEDAAFPRATADLSTLGKRLFVFGVALGLTIYGAREMYAVVSVSGTTTLQYGLLALFVINFSWIALAFSSAVLGFLKLLLAPTPLPARPSKIAVRVAILMPVYNELTARTFAALEAIRESVEATGHGHAFDYFVLSDSTNPDAWIAEERAFLDLRARLGPASRLFYRHREKNHHRKAGNIADFVTRWGGAYEHMIVLDADSLMTGECILTLVAADGGGSARRHRPEPAGDRQPQHAARARPAIRGARDRASGRDRTVRVVGTERQLLGPQRDHPDARLCGALRTPRSARQPAFRRSHPQPRFRGGSLDAPGWLDRDNAARTRGQL